MVWTPAKIKFIRLRLTTEELAARLRQGDSLSEIARYYSVTPSAVWQRARRAGLQTPPRTKRRVPPDDTLRRLALTHTATQIAEAHGCSRRSVMRHLTRLGVEALKRVEGPEQGQDSSVREAIDQKTVEDLLSEGMEIRRQVHVELQPLLRVREHLLRLRLK